MGKKEREVNEKGAQEGKEDRKRGEAEIGKGSSSTSYFTTEPLTGAHA